jgi:hypothetical protein
MHLLYAKKLFKLFRDSQIRILDPHSKLTEILLRILDPLVWYSTLQLPSLFCLQQEAKWQACTSYEWRTRRQGGRRRTRLIRTHGRPAGVVAAVPSIDSLMSACTSHRRRERRPMPTMCRQMKRLSCAPSVTRLLTRRPAGCHGGQSSFSHCAGTEARPLFLHWKNTTQHNRYWDATDASCADATGNLMPWYGRSS